MLQYEVAACGTQWSCSPSGGESGPQLILWSGGPEAGKVVMIC